MKGIIKISDDRINAILPQNIKDSEVLNNTDKKVLGVLLHYFLILDKAKMDKYVILSNTELSKSVGVRKADALSSVQNLIELNLIKRVCGKSRTEGEKAQASEYYIIWDNLKKPIKKPTFEDLFSSFISSENRMGTADTDTDTDTDTDKSTCSNSTCNNKTNKEKNNKKEKRPVDNGTVVISPSEYDFNKDLILIDMKENEMSDNGASVMNAKSEMKWNGKQGSNNVAECGKKNEMTTSLATAFNFQDQSNEEHCSIFKEDCPKPLSPQVPLTPLSPCEWDEDAILDAGASETSSMDNLSTNGNTTQPEAQECPQIEFNNERMKELFSLSERETNFERFKDYIRQMDEYMQYLKANDPYLFKLYKKEIYCWFARNTWDMNFDFIEVGGDFKRKYVA